MSIAQFVERTHILARFKRAMLTVSLPLVLLALIPTIITVCANLSSEELKKIGLILAALGCMAFGFIVARLETDDEKQPRWVMQASILPFAASGALMERSFPDYLLLAFWIGMMLFNGVITLRNASRGGDHLESVR